MTHSNPVSYLQEIDYDSPRGGVSVVIEKAKWTTSHLLIQKATSKDSGIYKCAPLNAVTATINLHVLRGEKEITGESLLTTYGRVIYRHLRIDSDASFPISRFLYSFLAVIYPTPGFQHQENYPNF